MGRTGDQPFDELKGHHVLVKFEKETDRMSGVSATGSHRGFRSVFEGNVVCILEYAVFRKVRNL